jgi:hypothetical protein
VPVGIVEVVWLEVVLVCETLLEVVVALLFFGRYRMPVLGHEPAAGASFGRYMPSMTEPVRVTGEHAAKYDHGRRPTNQAVVVRDLVHLVNGLAIERRREAVVGLKRRCELGIGPCLTRVRKDASSGEPVVGREILIQVHDGVEESALR